MVSGGRGCDLGLGFRGSREGESEEGRSTAQGGLQVDAGREGGPGMARQGELHGGMARQCATVATGKGRRERRMTGGAHWSVV